MSFAVLTRALTLFGLFILFLLAVSHPALAECNNGKIKAMLGQGKTIASIARTCEMSKEDILSIQEEEENDVSLGLPSGAPVGQCGCWGYVNPQLLQPHPQCQSGYARPNMCNAVCPMGGFAWRGVCA